MTKNTKYGKFVGFIWIAFASATLGVAGIFGAASAGLLGTMPDFRQLENPKTNLATQIISADNRVLGKFYFNDNRTPISYDEIPSSMIDALIATEDERFYSHSGIDFKENVCIRVVVVVA